MQREGPRLARDLAGQPDVQQKFLSVLGRLPYPGELEEMAARYAATQVETNAFHIGSLLRLQRQIDTRLRRHAVQVATIASDLPGLALGDVPVVHAQLATQRFGFAEDLAIDDADLIWAPISRRVAVLFTAEPMADAHVRTKKLLRKLNALTLRTALREVACHPDDALHLQRLQRDLSGILPIHQLSGR
jgi:hypothetical protein